MPHSSDAGIGLAEIESAGPASPIGLRRGSARGAALTLGGQVAKLAIQVSSTAVLARLLAPQDFGLVAMTFGITGFLTVFGDLGLSAATVQRPEINHRQISTLFGLNVALSAGITLLTVAIAPAVARFYHEPRLTLVTALLGFGFLVTGISVQHRALLRRNMRFGALTAIEIAGGAAWAVTGILLAWLGVGYLSLIAAQLAMSVTGTAAAWLLCKWRPGLPSRRVGIRSMVMFGGNLTVFTFLNYFIRNLDNVLIGWRWGAQALGLYSRAYQLLLFPLGQIVAPLGSVTVPSLSRLQDDASRYRSYYLRSINILSYVTIPLTAALVIFADEIVHILLGPQWRAAGEIFRILAVASVLQPVGSTVGWIYTSLDRTEIMAKWGALAASIVLPAFAVGLPWGPLGVAKAYCVVSCLLTYPCFAIALRGTPVSVADVVGAIRRPVAIGCIEAIALLLCRSLFARLGAMAMLAVSGAAAALLLVMIRGLWAPVRADLNRIVDDARLIWSRQVASVASYRAGD